MPKREDIPRWEEINLDEILYPECGTVVGFTRGERGSSCVLGSCAVTRAGIIARCRQRPDMPEVWSERIGVTHTMRENILLYLSQEGEVKKEELRSTIGMTRDSTDQHLRFLEEHGFVARQLDRSMQSEYQLTDKGDELVAELRWGDQS